MNLRHFVLLLGFLVVTPAFAGSPIGGLTLAISPDGETLIAGGDNRTLYVLDPDTLEIKKRVWLGTTIRRMSYNKDGSTIAVEDTDGVVHFLKAADYSKTKEQPELEKMATSRSADIAVGLDDDYQGNAVRFYSLTDGSEKGKILFPKGIRISCFGINQEGTTVAVLQQAQDDDTEKKVSYRDIPKDLKGLDRDIFEQKNDGKSAIFQLYKVPSGEKISEHKLFYSSSIGVSEILFDGDDALVVNYSNENARIKADGTVEMFELENSYNYGIGFSSSHDMIFSGGLRNGTVTTVAGMQTKSFRIQELPGWPEYFKGFCSNDDGAVYGSTSAYRVIKINRSGQIEKEAACF